MRSYRVIEDAPSFDNDLRLSQRVEQLAVEQIVAELAIKRFTVAVLPRTDRRDVQGFGA